LIFDLLEIIIVTTEPVRPGRKYPRNFKKKRGVFRTAINLFAKVNDIAIVVFKKRLR